MNKKIITSAIILLCVASFSASYGQADEIKDKANDQKESKSPENRHSSGSGNRHSHNDADDNLGGCVGNFFGYLFVEMFKGSQMLALSQKPEYPYVTSFDANLWAGYSSNHNALLFAPGLKGNWGILSTDIRFVGLHDNTGSLNNFDWQVVKLNIPVKTFRASAGVGFTYLFDPGVSYFEYTFGAELRLRHDKMVLSAEYRDSPADGGSHFRREFSLQTDYEIRSSGSFHLSPMAGVRYQRYFDEINYVCVNVGLVVRFY